MPNKSSETKRFSFLWMPWTARPMRHILSSLLPTMPTQIQGWPTKNQVSKPKEFKFGCYFFSGSEWWFRSSKRNRKPKKMANKVNEKITRGFFVFQIANSWTSIIFSASTFSKLYFSTTYDRGGCSKGAVGIEEKMKNDDFIMYLTFHPQMVDNVWDFEPCSKPEF